MPQLIMQRPDLLTMQRLDLIEHPSFFLIIMIISLFLVLFALALLFKNN
ncbi:MAG TPA: hypothetical protein VKY65_10180 [Alphaproteobacteria bacterium]|nr:hypothetical protein [Alphaproteobacteria bacterium]